MSELIKGLSFYFVNYILNKVPSRRIRIFFYYYLSGKRISRKSSIGLGVKFLDIRGISVGDHSNINFDCILDGRGEGIVIGSNVDIAPQVNIWSLGHNPYSAYHESVSKKVVIEEGCWLANRVLVLPGTHLKRNTVAAAGSVLQGTYEESKVLKGQKARPFKDSFFGGRQQLRRVRVFR